MSTARKTFVRVFVAFLLLGVLLGVFKLLAPEAITVTLNHEDKTGFAALLTATGVGAVLGLAFGLISAGIVAIFARRTD